LLEIFGIGANPGDTFNQELQKQKAKAFGTQKSLKYSPLKQ